jgi:hypothetical protein
MEEPSRLDGGAKPNKYIGIDSRLSQFLQWDLGLGAARDRRRCQTLTFDTSLLTIFAKSLSLDNSFSSLAAALLTAL